jgi:hypothetical protein
MQLVELIRRPDAASAFPRASPDVELERSVWDRLYGKRAGVTATPIAHGAAPLGRLVGGRYRLVDRLGTGGMATVDSATPLRTRTRCTAPWTTGVRRTPPLCEGRPGLPSGLSEAVQQALAPEPDARQESVAEFRAQRLNGQTPSPRSAWRAWL